MPKVKRSLPDSAMEQKETVTGKQDKMLKIESSLGNCWTPDLLLKHLGITANKSQLKKLRDDEGIHWGIYRKPEDDPAILPLGVKKVTSVWNDGVSRDTLKNDSRENLYEEETEEAWKLAKKGAKASAVELEDGSLGHEVAKAGEGDDFCAAAMFPSQDTPNKNAKETRKRQASTTGGESSRPKQHAKAAKTKVQYEGGVRAKAPSDKSKRDVDKRRVTRLMITAKKVVQGPSCYLISFWFASLLLSLILISLELMSG